MKAVAALILMGLLLPGVVNAEDQDDDDVGMFPREASVQHLRLDTAYPVEKGELEIELVSSYLRSDDGKEYPSLVELEAGISERLTLELEYEYSFVDSDEGGHVHGTRDVAVEAKYLATDDGPLAVAFALEAGSVTEVEEDDDEIERNLGIEAYTAVSYEVSDRLRAHLQAGFEAVRSEGPEKFLNLAIEGRPFEIGLIPQLALNVEWEANEKPETSLVPGLLIPTTYGPLKKVAIGVPIGLSDEAQNLGVILEVELEF